MNRSIVKSFEARLEFEHVVESKALAKGAYYGLLPHFGMGTVGAILSPNMLGLIGALTDLVPFILPDRWIRAEERSLFAQAVDESLFLMKINAASITENLAHAIARDSRVIEVLNAKHEKIQTYRDLAYKSETSGKVPAGTTTDLDLLLGNLEKVINAFQKTFNDEKRALAQAAGFLNPDAIISVTDEDPRCERRELPFQGNLPQIQQFAFSQSHELVQMDKLIHAAENQETEYYFSWLDPSNYFNENDGIPISAKIIVNRAHVAELRIQKEQLQTTLLQKTGEAVNTYNAALKLYELSLETNESIKGRLAQLLKAMKTGTDFSSASLIQTLQEDIRNTSGLMTAQTDCQSALGRLNRLTLQSVYAKAELPTK
jgi:ferritin